MPKIRAWDSNTDVMAIRSLSCLVFKILRFLMLTFCYESGKIGFPM
jgi:hypothetical protein